MIYDLIIIGSGPAGITAGIYAINASLKTIIFESIEQPSLLTLAHNINNFPGFPLISGQELLEKMKKHLESLGGKITQETVIDISINKNNFDVITSSGKKYKGKTIIIATGTKHRKANIPGEEEFLGKGVSYCATCDGAFFKGKDVIVFGGGNTALTYALYLSNIGCKTTLIYYKDKSEMKTFSNLLESAEKNNVKFIFNKSIKEIKGNKFVEKVILDDGKEIKTSAVFIAIGEIPLNSLAKKIKLELDERGYIKVNEKCETNIPGIYAAGDVRSSPLKQIVTAAADGAIAAISASQYLKLQGERNAKGNKK
ncbi:MAG: FAD-dependent oxidoreductase [Candidatus Aenigmatarchaeota archaeon]|nr:FAD-dependent oxidoreductase [Candidatus Aenigmarchaeota archaeon]